MLTEVVRMSLSRVSNRFELVVLTSERCRQLLAGARPTVENPTRERLMKVAMREIVGDRVMREGDSWRIDRPQLPDIFTPPSEAESAELLAAAGTASGDDKADEEE